MRTRIVVAAAAIALSWSFCASAQTPASSSAAEPGVGAGQLAQPAHPATEAQIREYFALNGAVKLAHTVMSQMVTAMHTTAVPYLPASFWDDLNAEMLNLDLTAVYVPIYQKYLSEEDMGQVIAFYRSSAGKNLLGAQPFLIRDAQETLQAQCAKIAERIYEKHRDEIEAAKKQYESSHGVIDLGPAESKK